MSHIALAERWHKSPNAPVDLNPLNWIAQQVRFALIATPWGAYDAVSGNYLFKSTPTTSVANGEICWNYPTSAAEHVGTFSRYIPDLDTNKPATIFVRGTHAYSSNELRMVVYSGGGHGWVTTLSKPNVSTMSLRAGGVWTGSSAAVDIPMPTATVINSCITYIPGSGSRDLTVGLYLDRIDWGTATHATARDPNPVPRASAQIGLRKPQYANVVPNAPSMLAVVMAGVLPFHAYLELDENPWQIFKPRKRVVYFLGGIGRPTLSLPGVTDIGTTSARPRVMLTY